MNVCLNIVDYCPLRCVYCFRKTKGVKLAEKELVKKGVRKVKKDFRAKKITITGGEPLVCPPTYLKEIIKIIKDENLKVSLTTSLYKKVDKGILKMLDAISVSVDSVKVKDIIFHRRKSITLKNLKSLYRKVKIKINMVITYFNRKSIKESIKKINTSSIKRIKVFKAIKINEKDREKRNFLALSKSYFEKYLKNKVRKIGFKIRKKIDFLDESLATFLLVVKENTFNFYVSYMGKDIKLI